MASKKCRDLAPEFVQHVLPKLPSAPLKATDITEEFALKMTERLTQSKQHALATYWPKLQNGVEVEDLKIRLRDGDETVLRKYVPADKSCRAKMPVLYALHGGAFISGSIEAEDLVCRQLCLTSSALVFSLEYRLAPAHSLEEIFSDAEDGLKWCVENASKFGGDIDSGVVIEGTSSGGTLASTVAHRSASLGIKPRGLILRQPALILGSYEDLAPKEWHSLLRSREENWDMPLLSGSAVENSSNFLNLSRDTATEPKNFPIFALTEQLKGFPPTYLSLAECDPLVDEGELLASKLREAGVPVRTKLYKGMPHGFHAWHVLETAREETVNTADGLKWLLDQKRS